VLGWEKSAATSTQVMTCSWLNSTHCIQERTSIFGAPSHQSSIYPRALRSPPATRNLG
jgi:hypothetical protein